jgi:hypothetical protein
MNMESTRSRFCAVVCATLACLQLAACGGGSSSNTASGATPSQSALAQPTFTAHPKYLIGSVIYAPPGEAGSSLTYGFGTVTGTTMSTTQSWNKNAITGVSAGNNFVAFGNMFGGATSTSVDMLQNYGSNASVTWHGPASATINHDYDTIQIFLGVNVNAYVDDLGNITWSLDFSQMGNQGFAETAAPVAVGCLRSNSTIPPSECAGTLRFLSWAGITSADYPNILGADPFADPTASPTPDRSRYVQIGSLSYLPNSVFPTLTYTGINSTAITNPTTSTYSYSVNSSVSGSYDGVSLKNPNVFTWTNSSTQSNTTSSTGPITLTLSLPSSPYSGPTTLFVYLDTIYKTLMFSFNQ